MKSKVLVSPWIFAAILDGTCFRIGDKVLTKQDVMKSPEEIEAEERKIQKAEQKRLRKAERNKSL